MSTKDCGLTWEEHYEKNPAAMGKCIYVPEKDIFIKLIDAAKLDPEKPTPKFKNGGSGIYALISKTGSDDTNYEVYKVCDDTAHILRHVIYSASSGLLIATGENVTDEIYYSIVFTTADGGKTWNKQYLKPLDVYPVTYPDKDIRWQNHSCEPTIIKLTEDELMIIFRTSYNYHYKYMSYDGGKTWSDPMPTDFHATLTMPAIRRMTDGDIIFIWCNTQPLPEFEHKSAVPSPDMVKQDVLFISRIKDDRLISEVQGAVWNFPAGKKGVFTAEIMNKGKGVALSLTDRWFNPIDTYVREAAQISVNIDGSCIPYDKWCTVRVLWDCDEKNFSVYADDDKVCGGEIKGSCQNGLCYAHFQSLAEDVDSLGTYIRFMEKK